MRCVCGYLMLNGRCPVCDGRQPAGLEPIGCIIPRALRAFFVVPSHFESRRHYHAGGETLGWYRAWGHAGRRAGEMRWDDVESVLFQLADYDWRGRSDEIAERIRASLAAQGITPA